MKTYRRLKTSVNAMRQTNHGMLGTRATPQARRCAAAFVSIAAAFLLCACDRAQNNPHPAGSEASNTLFLPFTGRSPKYLDPASSYSNDESPYTYQVYEPPYGYHYLKRPYELTGRAAREVAPPQYLDKAGKPLPDTAPGELVAQTVYDIRIRPGIQFAPHPAFAKDTDGRFVYHDLKASDVADKHQISDFAQTGTRELTAEDYVYAIRRLATPRVVSPSFSTWPITSSASRSMALQ